MVYLVWLLILLIPYWLGPIVVWLTQQAGARPVFEPFTPGRHSVPEDVAAARPARLVASYAELPTKFRDGRTVSVYNSPLPGSFTPRPPRFVVPLPIVRDPARLCRIKRAYLERHYRGVERVPFAHQGEPARFVGEAMVRELTEQVEAGACKT